jgi:hypothetical protein
MAAGLTKEGGLATTPAMGRADCLMGPATKKPNPGGMKPKEQKIFYRAVDEGS